MVFTFMTLKALMTLMTLIDTWILGYLLWSALVYIDLPWSAWAVSDHHRKAQMLKSYKLDGMGWDWMEISVGTDSKSTALRS